MIKRICPLLLLACLSGAQAATDWKDAVCSLGGASSDAFVKTIDALDQHAGSITISIIALAAGCAALCNYLMKRKYREDGNLWHQYDQALNNMRSKSQELAVCKVWADDFYMRLFDDLGIEPEVLNNRESWPCVINNLSADAVSSFARATGLYNLVSLDLKAKLQYAERIFDEYKDCYSKIERIVDCLNLRGLGYCVDGWNRLREEYAYFVTMVPVYLNKMAFVQQLVEQRRADFERVAKECNNNYCDSCIPCCCN